MLMKGVNGKCGLLLLLIIIIASLLSFFSVEGSESGQDMGRTRNQNQEDNGTKGDRVSRRVVGDNGRRRAREERESHYNSKWTRPRSRHRSFVDWESTLLENEWEAERAAGLVTVSVIPEQRHVSAFLSRGMYGR
jgi:hypothetical protein